MQRLSQLETEATINAYINALELPPAVLGQVEDKYRIEPSLEEEIRKCQEVGGTNAMFSITSQIDKMTLNLENRLKYCFGLLSSEAADDHKNREQYGNKWILKASNEISKPIRDQIEKCSQILRNTRVYDSQAKQYIIDNTKNFEWFNLTRKQLCEQLRLQVNGNKLQPLTQEEEIIKKELNALLAISTQIKDQVEKIYAEFNSDSKYHPLFLGVLDSQTTEQAIYENQKQLYVPMFHCIEETLPKIKKHKDTINSTLHSIKLKKHQSNPMEPHPLSKELSAYTMQFQKHYMKLTKGLNYYKELQNEITRIEQTVADFLSKRSQEKAALLQTLGNRFETKASYQNYVSHNDPNSNIWTNMSVKNFVYKK